MSNNRHHQQTAPAQWAQATWTWGSAFLLSALLVSPVGADALFHLLRLHLPAVVQAAERSEIAVPVQDSTPRRKSEDEAPTVSADTHATPDTEPTPTYPADSVIASLAVIPSLPIVASIVLPTAPHDDRLRSVVVLHRIPRAPPV